MNNAIKKLRDFFDSEEWTKACKEDQPIVSDQGIVTAGEGDFKVSLDTKINLALDFEGKFADFASAYMKWRKSEGLSYND